MAPAYDTGEMLRFVRTDSGGSPYPSCGFRLLEPLRSWLPPSQVGWMNQLDLKQQRGSFMRFIGTER